MGVRLELVTITIEVTSNTEFGEVRSDTNLEPFEGIPQTIALAAALNGLRATLAKVQAAYDKAMPAEKEETGE